jgi:hypothetical protein
MATWSHVHGKLSWEPIALVDEALYGSLDIRVGRVREAVGRKARGCDQVFLGELGNVGNLSLRLSFPVQRDDAGITAGDVRTAGMAVSTVADANGGARRGGGHRCTRSLIGSTLVRMTGVSVWRMVRAGIEAVVVNVPGEGGRLIDPVSRVLLCTRPTFAVLGVPGHTGFVSNQSAQEDMALTQGR